MNQLYVYIPGERNGNLLQYSYLGNPMDRGAWRAIVHGVAKSWTWLNTHAIYIHVFPPSWSSLPERLEFHLLETDVCRKNFPPSLFLGSYSWLHFPRLFFRINPLPAYKSILLLSGERGCGKSTLLANWVNCFKTKYPNMVLIPHFVGSTCESSDIMSVIHYFITELQYKHYGNGIRLWNSFRKILFKSDHSVFCPRGYFSLVPI